MAETKEQSLSNYKIPGMRGPRERNVEKPKEGRRTLGRLIRYFSDESRVVFFLLAVVFVVVIASVYAPRLQSDAIDSITAGDFQGLPRILIAMLLVYGIHSLGTFLQSRESAILSQRVVRRMREDLFDCVVNLPVKYIDGHSHGDIMSRMTNDVENISNTVAQLAFFRRADGDRHGGDDAVSMYAPGGAVLSDRDIDAGGHQAPVQSDAPFFPQASGVSGGAERHGGGDGGRLQDRGGL